MKKPSDPQTDTSAPSVIDIAAIDQLARIVSKYDLSEIEVSVGDLQVRLGRQRAPEAHTSVAAAPAAAPNAAMPPQGSTAGLPTMAQPADIVGAVKSPMVGTAYLRASPDAKPFVEVGTVVKVGDKLLLIEAMKTFNDIVATRAGKVVTILVEDGSPVEYDQPLMIVE